MGSSSEEGGKEVERKGREMKRRGRNSNPPLSHMSDYGAV